MAEREPWTAPATARNREPILAVLRRVLPESGACCWKSPAAQGEHARLMLTPLLPGWTWCERCGRPSRARHYRCAMPA